MAAFIGFVVFCHDPPYVPSLLLLLLLQASHRVAMKAAPEQASTLQRDMLQVAFVKVDPGSSAALI